MLDPREELIRRLLEYQKYKDAAEKLGGRPIEGRNVFGRGMSLVERRARRPLRRAVGLEADRGVRADPGEGGRDQGDPRGGDRSGLDRRSHGPAHRPHREPAAARSSSRPASICRCPRSELRNQVVVTLLAILELARLKVVRVLQSPDGETLFITQAAGVTLEARARGADRRRHEPGSVEAKAGEADGRRRLSEDSPKKSAEKLRDARDVAERVRRDARGEAEETLEEKNEQT